jgi:hypothetical protein
MKWVSTPHKNDLGTDRYELYGGTRIYGIASEMDRKGSGLESRPLHNFARGSENLLRVGGHRPIPERNLRGRAR